MEGYPTREVATLLGLSTVQVRGFARAGGMLRLRGRYRFAFRDVSLMRAVSELLAARIPASRIRNQLTCLRRQLSPERPLSEISLVAEGQRVYARDADRLWEPDSGQFLFDFDSLAPTTLLSTVAPAEPDALAAAEEWFALGMELEGNAPVAAREAYARALALAPAHADAHVNLGRLWHEDGETVAAAAHYRQALAIRPDHETAAFNLAVALEDMGDRQEAMAVYRRVLEANPRCADAHFNLAKLYERAGDTRAALRHLHHYRALLESGAGD
jgi:tetratricopeptide (TPR) repeat protein